MFPQVVGERIEAGHEAFGFSPLFAILYHRDRCHRLMFKLPEIPTALFQIHYILGSLFYININLRYIEFVFLANRQLLSGWNHHFPLGGFIRRRNRNGPFFWQICFPFFKPGT